MNIVKAPKNKRLVRLLEDTIIDDYDGERSLTKLDAAAAVGRGLTYVNTRIRGAASWDVDDTVKIMALLELNPASMTVEEYLEIFSLLRLREL